MKKIAGIIGLFVLTACDSAGVYYPPSSSPSTSVQTGVTISGSVRTGAVYGRR